MHYVYLAGPIGQINYAAANGWRQDWLSYFEGRQDIQCLSPLRGKEWLSTLRGLSIGFEKFGDETPLCTDQSIMSRDHFDCCRADVVVFNLLGCGSNSVGTTMELAWCYHLHTPVVLILDEGSTAYDHPMVRAINGFRCSDHESAIQIVEAILNPNYKGTN